MTHLIHIAQVLTALAAFFVLGAVPIRLMRIEAGFPGNIALRIATGLVVGSLYFFLRLTIAEMTGLPVYGWELWALTAVCLWMEVRSGTRFYFRSEPQWIGKALVGLVAVLLLAYYGVPKLSQFGLPSSDPDIHAYFLKITLSEGRILDTIPGSDVPLRYPLGFVALNWPLAVLSFLSPVQVVNIQPYLQGLLLVFALLAFPNRLKSRTDYLVFCLASLITGTISFSPSFSADRLLMDGTARLSHGLMMFLPALLAWLYRPNAGEKSLTLHAVLCGWLAAFSMLINPAHVFPTVLLTGIAVLLMNPGMARAWGWRYLAATGGFVVLVAFFDPYYRNLLAGQAILIPEVPQLGPLIHLPVWSNIGRAAEHFLAFFLDVFSGRRYFWTKILVIMAVALTIQGISKNEPKINIRRALLAFSLFTASSFVFLTALHLTFNANRLLGFLFLKYTGAALAQAYAIGILALMGWIIRSLLQAPNSRGRKGIAIAVLLLGWWVIGIGGHRSYYGALETALASGHITEDDVRLVKWAEQYIPDDERVIGPTSTQAGHPEDEWVFAQWGFRAFPLYSNVKTAFFYGLDGSQFNYKSHQRYIANGVDYAWLREQKILWLYTSNQIFNRFDLSKYELKFQTGASALWRLRPL